MKLEFFKEPEPISIDKIIFWIGIIFLIIDLLTLGVNT